MTALAAKVDEFFSKSDAPDSPGYALAVIKAGEVMYKRGYGIANIVFDFIRNQQNQVAGFNLGAGDIKHIYFSKRFS